jgi:integrase
MKLDLPYVHQPAGKSHRRYRRKVPEAFRPVVGKAWIIIPLGNTDAEVVRHWPKAHAQAEKMLRTAATGKQPEQAPMTALERYRWATRHVADWGIDPKHVDIVADDIRDNKPHTPDNIALYQALVTPDRKPEATLTDAVRLYLKDRVEGTPDEVKKRQRVERVHGHIKTALGRDPEIRSLTRPDAREVKNYMLSLTSPSTVKRYMNDIRAIISHGIRELDLRDAMNPFNGLEVKLDGYRKDDRKPFSDAQLKAAHRRIIGHASADLQRIWRVLKGTGCRLSEVAGLLTEDVHLEGEFPYLDIQPHPHRRLKNNGSARWVPLIGDALDAAREAVRATNGRFLFPNYAERRTQASAALMKQVRAVVADPKVTIHSLRHTIKDRLISAEVPTGVQDLILGQSSGAVSENYGGPLSRLKVAKRALEKALG